MPKSQLGVSYRPLAHDPLHGECFDDTKAVYKHFWLTAIPLLTVAPPIASEHRGEVLLNGIPVPGATVTATRGNQKFIAFTDSHGMYSFSGLTDGTRTIQVEMQGFAPLKPDIGTAPNAPAAEWDLRLLPLDQIQAVAPTRSQVAASPVSIKES